MYKVFVKLIITITTLRSDLLNTQSSFFLLISMITNNIQHQKSTKYLRIKFTNVNFLPICQTQKPENLKSK